MKEKKKLSYCLHRTRKQMEKIFKGKDSEINKLPFCDQMQTYIVQAILIANYSASSFSTSNFLAS